MTLRKIPILASLAVVALTPAAADAARERPRCNPAGPNLAASRLIKVVARNLDGEEDGARLLGCVRPNGRVRTIALAPAPGLGTASLRVADVAGTWVLVSSSSSNQYGGGSALRLVDVRTARGYTVFSQSAAIGDPQPSPQLAAWGINSRGWSAVVLDELDPSRRPNEAPRTVARRVVLHDPRGRARALDTTFDPSEIDPRSLILDEHTVLWTHAGAVQYARF